MLLIVWIVIWNALQVTLFFFHFYIVLELSNFELMPNDFLWKFLVSVEEETLASDNN